MLYTNYARWFCEETTGHDQTWPEDYNGECPECSQEIELDHKILISEKDVVYHFDHYTDDDKPEFTYQIHTS